MSVSGIHFVYTRFSTAASASLSAVCRVGTDVSLRKPPCHVCAVPVLLQLIHVQVGQGAVPVLLQLIHVQVGQGGAIDYIGCEVAKVKWACHCSRPDSNAGFGAFDL